MFDKTQVDVHRANVINRDSVTTPPIDTLDRCITKFTRTGSFMGKLMLASDIIAPVSRSVRGNGGYE